MKASKDLLFVNKKQQKNFDFLAPGALPPGQKFWGAFFQTSTASYEARKAAIGQYFDRTALSAWEKLTSDAPVSGIRATVRAGREAMRENILAWLPADMRGLRLLDAGCGTGALALAAAARGAEVVAIDLSPQLVALAATRAQGHPGASNIVFRSGDMLDPALGRFDYVVLMDSIIHYPPADVLAAIKTLAARTDRALIFTFAPRTRLLTLMHLAGKLFPRGDKSPAIVPQSESALRCALPIARSHRVHTGFYISQAMELRL